MSRRLSENDYLALKAGYKFAVQAVIDGERVTIAEIKYSIKKASYGVKTMQNNKIKACDKNAIERLIRAIEAKYGRYVFVITKRL